MNKVLIINASVRKERSQSRKLTQLFQENWKRKNPNDRFTHREV
jgi:FMN-dependent NADH-azoreductase